MRKTAFVTMDTVCNPHDAERLIASLRNGGLHPVDLALSAPLAFPGTHSEFPIQVPAEEFEAAAQILERLALIPR